MATASRPAASERPAASCAEPGTEASYASTSSGTTSGQKVPRGLISALRKLDAYAGRIPLDQPNPAMNNMFIIEPAMSVRSMANLFATHPPTEKRIEALSNL